MTDRHPSAEAGTFFVAAIGLSIVSWPISFTLGAYGEVFYRDALTVWVASLAALIAGPIAGRNAEGEAFITWRGAILLLVPSVYLLSSALNLNRVPYLVYSLEWLLLVGAIPYIGYILLTVATPQAIELRTPRLVIGLICTVIAINAASFAAGIFNGYFMTCDEFIRAGDQPPSDCWKGK